MRLVVDGHITEIPLLIMQYAVLSLKGIRLVIFLAELNGLELCGRHSKLLLRSLDKNVCIIDRPEFGPLKDYALIFGLGITFDI